MRTLFLIFSIFLSHAVLGQGLQTAILYMTDGKLKYAAAKEENFSRVRAGTEVTSEGILQLGKGKRAGLFRNGTFLILEGPGTFALAEVLQDRSAFQETDASRIFATSLEEASDPYFANVTLGRSGFAAVDPGSGGSTPTSLPGREGGSKPPPKKSKSGHGNKNYSLIRWQPAGGLVTTDGVVFRWTVEQGGSAKGDYRLSITNENGELIFEGNTRKPVFEWQPDTTVPTERDYIWQVKETDGTTAQSAPTTFSLTSTEERSGFFKKLYRDALYQTADAATRSLLEASFLDYLGYQADAAEQYRALSKKESKNELIQNTYEAFLWRHDLVPDPN